MKKNSGDKAKLFSKGTHDTSTPSTNITNKMTNRTAQSISLRPRLVKNHQSPTGSNFISDSVTDSGAGKQSFLNDFLLRNSVVTEQERLKEAEKRNTSNCAPCPKCNPRTQKSHPKFQELPGLGSGEPDPSNPHSSSKPAGRQFISQRIKELELLKNPMISNYMKGCNPFYIYYRRNLLSRLDFKTVAGIVRKGNGEFESTISLYKVEERIGKGSFGEVFKARQMGTNLPVALKVLPRSIYQDSSLIAKLQTEINITKMMSDYPGIVRLLESFRDQTNIYCVFEYMPGKDLNHFFVKNELFDEEELAHLAFNVLEGINYIHSKDYIHRDIKTENILLDKYLNPKIGDFGLSTVAESLTFEKDTCGTPTYLAPEVFVQGETVSKKTDLWSLGVMLYKLKFDQLPFDGETYDELYLNILRGQINYLEEKPISSSLANLIQSLLHKKQSQRLSAKDALGHPWFARGVEADPADVEESKLRAIWRRAAILTVLNELGFPPETVIRSLMDNLFNHCSACYWNMVNNPPV